MIEKANLACRLIKRSLFQFKPCHVHSTLFRVYISVVFVRADIVGGGRVWISTNGFGAK